MVTQSKGSRWYLLRVTALSLKINLGSVLISFSHLIHKYGMTFCVSRT